MRSDWNTYIGAGNDHQVDTEHVYAENSALKVNEAGNISAEVLASSEADAPSDGRITSWIYAEGRILPAAYFRFQDGENYYRAQFGYNNNFGDEVLVVHKFVNGAVTDVGTNTAYNGGKLPDDNSNYSGRYALYRITAWEDSGGDYRFRIESDVNEDGWTALTDDVVDTAPDLGGGGAIGIGGHDRGLYYTDRGYSAWFDETEVYY